MDKFEPERDSLSVIDFELGGRFSSEERLGDGSQFADRQRGDCGALLHSPIGLMLRGDMWQGEIDLVIFLSAENRSK